jgi:hypothetical protein
MSGVVLDAAPHDRQIVPVNGPVLTRGEAW